MDFSYCIWHVCYDCNLFTTLSVSVQLLRPRAAKLGLGKILTQSILVLFMKAKSLKCMMDELISLFEPLHSAFCI